ncbi:UDP-N-acetylglucosamine transferase subunit ALG14 [Brassica napus]|uniref:UDP-N-acetylglucosamine transferase subunit ALG14 n=1 Tax=Brassica napus TaxID=3708 RepID=UPI002078C986|nr:UDP-N-acetylglucosamine transferase subunit ALG14 [Brassica napus]
MCFKIVKDGLVSRCSFGLSIVSPTLHGLLVLLLFLVLILCDDLETCTPLCVIAFLFKFKLLGVRWSSIFFLYVENVARVKKLSLSGFMHYKLRTADQLFIQWPQLQNKYPRAHYAGSLM